MIFMLWSEEFVTDEIIVRLGNVNLQMQINVRHSILKNAIKNYVAKII